MCYSLYGLSITFSSNCYRPVRILFRIHKLPWALVFRVFRPALVVTLKPLLYVLRRANVITAVFLAPENVNVIHYTTNKKGVHRFGESLIKMAGATRLELATFPLYKRDVLTN